MTAFDFDAITSSIVKEGTCMFALKLHDVKIQKPNEVQEKLEIRLTERTNATFATVHE